MKRTNPDAKAFLAALLGVVLMVLAFLVIIAVVSIARAQAAEFTFSPIEWGANPVVAAIALAGAVAWIRNTNWGSRIDGPAPVALLSLAVGAAGGVALQLTHMLTALPYSEWRVPLGGLAYGASLAVFNITGLAIWSYLGSKVRPISVNVSDGLVPLAFAGAQERPGSSVADFILGLVKNAVSAAKLPAALVAVAPLLAQFAQSEAILTDDLRSTLQGKVLSILRKAGLAGVDL